MSEWLGLIGVVVGGVITGGIAIYVFKAQLQSQRDIEAEKRLLANYENIYALLSRIGISIGKFATSSMGRISVTDGTSPTAEAWSRQDEDWEPLLDQLELLVDFHAPGLRADVESLRKTVGEIVEILIGWTLAKPTTPEVNEHNFLETSARNRVVRDQVRATQAKVALLARSITQPSHPRERLER